jgi:ribosomal protein S27E
VPGRKASSEEAKPKSTIFFTDVSKWLGGPTVIAGEKEDVEDELDRVMKEATRRKIQHLKMTELDKYLWETKKEALEARKEVEQLKRELEKMGVVVGGPSEGSPSSEEPQAPPAKEYVEVAKMLADLPEDKREAVINAYMMLRSADRLGPAATYMLPLMASYMKTHPSATQADLIRLAEAMTNQFRTAFEMARSQSQGQGGQMEAAVALAKAIVDVAKAFVPQVNPIDVVKATLELVLPSKQLQEAIEKLPDKIAERVGGHGILDRVFLDEQVYERVKSLIAPHASPEKPEVAIEVKKLETEMEKMRREHEMKLEEMRQRHDIEMERLRQEYLKWLYEQQRDEKMWTTLLQGPLGNVIAGLGSLAVDKLRGSAVAQQGQPQAQAHSSEMELGTYLKPITCGNCKAVFYADTSKDQVTCPFCRATLKRPSHVEEVVEVAGAGQGQQGSGQA